MDSDQVIKFLSRTLPFNLRNEPELNAIQKWLKSQIMFSRLLKFICLFICISFFGVIVASLISANMHSATVSIRNLVILSIAILVSALNYYFLRNRENKLHLTDDEIKLFIKATR